ncbi:MAG: hypothetical protein HQL87_14185 [Magnetococcales bacterium]|nr:hypothetical protein [Magnetococcales bacterium]
MDNSKEIEFIVNTVKGYWAGMREPMLLSQLGQNFKNQFPLIPDGLTLRVFIERHLSDQLAVVCSQKSPLAVAVVPVEVEEQGREFMEKKFQASATTVMTRQKMDTGISPDLVKRSVLMAFSLVVHEGKN